MPILSAVEISKSIPERSLFSELSCAVEPGDRIGIVGRNGSGKSSLIRVLVGSDAPDQGEIVRAHGVRLGYLAQEPKFEPGHTAVQAVLSGKKAWSEAMAKYEAISAQMSRGEGDVDAQAQVQAELAQEIESLGGWDIEHMARSCLSHFGLASHDRVVQSMSGGEQRRVALAQLLVSEPDIAVLDEPTNHLDLYAIEGLESWLKDRFRGAVVMVTHDRRLLSNIATHTWEIEQGILYRYTGGWEAYLSGKGERLAQAAREDANRRNFLRKELEWLRRQPKARSTKQKARVERAESALAQTPLKTESSASFTVGEHRHGKMLLEADALSVRRGDKMLVQDFTLRLQPGQRIGIVGPNGCGKSSLLSTLLGQSPPESGELRQGKHLKIAYLDQMRETLNGAESVYDNVAQERTQIVLGNETLTLRNYLERFLIDGSMQRRLVSTLSGGERARVALARILAQDANLVVLDEPTNDLDVDTLTALESCMMDFGGCLLLVTHDRFLLDRVATHLLAFEAGSTTVQLHNGNYALWQEKQKQKQKQVPEAKTAAEPKADPPAPTKKQKAKGLTYAERLELEGLPEKLEAVDEKVDALQAVVLEPEFYQQALAEQQAHQKALADAQELQGQLYARWEELETKSSALEGG